MEPVRFFETLVCTDQSTWRQNPEEHYFFIIVIKTPNLSCFTKFNKADFLFTEDLYKSIFAFYV